MFENVSVSLKECVLETLRESMSVQTEEESLVFARQCACVCKEREREIEQKNECISMEHKINKEPIYLKSERKDGFVSVC